MPNDYPRVTDLSTIRDSGDPPSALRTLRRLAPYALAIGAVGLAVASRYRPRYSFENKVVLITGGSRGLGLALARELASRGAVIGLLARDGIELARARRTIDSDSMVQLLPADVIDPAQVEHAFSTAVRRFGRIDVVINNAEGMLNVSRAALPHVARRGDGRIINICTTGMVAQDLSGKGIRVTTVRPGLMRGGSMSAERAARLILDASARGKADATIPFSAFSVPEVPALRTVPAVRAVSRGQRP